MGLRASDQDRERTVEFLRGQQAVGRLTVDELEERIAAALDAVEVADLAALTADLPASAPAPRPPRRRPRVPGRLPFSARWRDPVRRDVAMAELLADVMPPLQSHGYEVRERTSERIVFARTRTPGWVVIPCVLLFPFGLFALMIHVEDRIAIELIARGGETLLVASGTAPLEVRRAFAELEGV